MTTQLGGRMKEAANFGGLNFEMNSVATIRFADTVLACVVRRALAAVCIIFASVSAVASPSVASAAIISVVIIVVPLAILITIVGTTIVIAAAILCGGDTCRPHKGRGC
jgi:hypothetical protein